MPVECPAEPYLTSNSATNAGTTRVEVGKNIPESLKRAVQHAGEGIVLPLGIVVESLEAVNAG